MKKKNYLLLKNNGFTLLELLITIGLLGLVVLTVYSMYEFGQKTFRHESDEVVANTELRNAMDILISDCRKTLSFIPGEKKLMLSDRSEQPKLENGTLKLVSTYITDGRMSETILCYDVKEFVFDISGGEVSIRIVSKIKDSSGQNIFQEAVYYIRKDYD